MKYLIQDEERGLHEGCGQFIHWLQQHTHVNHQHPTNAYICGCAGMSSRTYSQVKKGY